VTTIALAVRRSAAVAGCGDVDQPEKDAVAASRPAYEKAACADLELGGE
jgi:hypothetical protein